ncbi:hypothetical protein TNCV_3124951 [Trichonephila clavipes]|nr:hypothetical protein TNCV_3124951 [Trichonephila clavipes]
MDFPSVIDEYFKVFLMGATDCVVDHCTDLVNSPGAGTFLMRHDIDGTQGRIYVWAKWAAAQGPVPRRK